MKNHGSTDKMMEYHFRYRHLQFRVNAGRSCHVKWKLVNQIPASGFFLKSVK